MVVGVKIATLTLAVNFVNKKPVAITPSTTLSAQVVTKLVITFQGTDEEDDANGKPLSSFKINSSKYGNLFLVDASSGAATSTECPIPCTVRTGMKIAYQPKRDFYSFGITNNGKSIIATDEIAFQVIDFNGDLSDSKNYNVDILNPITPCGRTYDPTMAPQSACNTAATVEFNAQQGYTLKPGKFGEFSIGCLSEFVSYTITCAVTVVSLPVKGALLNYIDGTIITKDATLKDTTNNKFYFNSTDPKFHNAPEKGEIGNNV
jgi:hypothetical protein